MSDNYQDRLRQSLQAAGINPGDVADLQNYAAQMNGETAPADVQSLQDTSGQMQALANTPSMLADKAANAGPPAPVLDASAMPPSSGDYRDRLVSALRGAPQIQDAQPSYEDRLRQSIQAAHIDPAAVQQLRNYADQSGAPSYGDRVSSLLKSYRDQVANGQEPDLLNRTPGVASEPEAAAEPQTAAPKNLMGDDFEAINKQAKENEDRKRQALIDAQKKAMDKWVKDAEAAHKAGQPSPPPPAVLQAPPAPTGYAALTDAQKQAVANDAARDRMRDQDRRELDTWAAQAREALKNGQPVPPKPRTLQYLDQGGPQAANDTPVQGNALGVNLATEHGDPYAAVASQQQQQNNATTAQLQQFYGQPPPTPGPVAPPPDDISKLPPMNNAQAASALQDTTITQGQYAKIVAHNARMASMAQATGPQPGHFAAAGAAQGGSAAPQDAGTPLHLVTGPGPQLIKGHEIPIVDPERQAALAQAEGSVEGAVMDEAKAQEQSNAANAEAKGNIAKQQASDATDLQQKEAARQQNYSRILSEYAQQRKDIMSMKVDPTAYWSKIGPAGAALNIVALAMGGFAAGFKGGHNQVMDIVNQNIDRDIAAQRENIANAKSGLDAKANELAMYKDQLGDERAAESAVRASRLNSLASYAEQTAITSQDPVQKARASKTAAMLQLELQKTLVPMNPMTKDQVVGGGGVPPAVMKAALDYAGKQVELSHDPSVFGNSRDQYLREAGYATGGRPVADKYPNVQGAGRQAGTQMEYQTNLNRLMTLKGQIAEAKSLVAAGGKLDPARTARAATLRDAMASELGYVNAGKSPNETELATAKSMLPSDFNSFQVTGADAAKLEAVERIVDEKIGQLRKVGPTIAGGAGFSSPPTGADESAAEAGGHED